MKSREKNKNTVDKEATSHSNEEEKETREQNNEEEREGIVPEGMDFKKFLGCGG